MSNQFNFRIKYLLVGIYSAVIFGILQNPVSEFIKEGFTIQGLLRQLFAIFIYGGLFTLLFTTWCNSILNNKLKKEFKIENPAMVIQNGIAIVNGKSNFGIFKVYDFKIEFMSLNSNQFVELINNYSKEKVIYEVKRQILKFAAIFGLKQKVSYFNFDNSNVKIIVVKKSPIEELLRSENN